jgi:uncharacterized protein with FMN-binding domain
MKRIVLWLLSTLSVLVLLFGYSTSTSGPEATSPPAVISGSASGTATKGGSAGPSSATTVTGEVASTQWGPVQVALTVDGGRITEVEVPQYPDGNPKDSEINGYALPTLIQETLDAQGSDIAMVSGATVTSTGYLQSLQSALDQAGL